MGSIFLGLNSESQARGDRILGRQVPSTEGGQRASELCPAPEFIISSHKTSVSLIGGICKNIIVPLLI